MFNLNLAIFGGSFDPPHFGHDSVVKAVLADLDIDKLIILPTFISPFKDSFFAPPNLRLKWVNLLWANLPQVEISEFEITQNCPVPTIQSVLHFKDGYEKIYLIIGADHVENLNKWHEFERLSRLVNFVVASRNNVQIPSDFKQLKISADVSSSQIRKYGLTNLVPQIIREDVIKFLKEKDAR